MKKGHVNNNLEIFNKMYRKIYDDITSDQDKFNNMVELTNKIGGSPKELVDFCYNDFCKMPINSNALVLGGGYGKEAKRLNMQYKKYNVYTIDISPWAEKLGNKIIKGGVNFLTGDMCNTSFEDNFFDIILSLNSLEHTSDIDKTMNEVFRIIKNNGLFGLMYPYKWGTDEQHVYMFEEDIVPYMSKFGEVEDCVSIEHQSRLLKIKVNKE